MSFVGTVEYNHCPQEKPSIPSLVITGASVLPITVTNNVTLNAVSLRFANTKNGTTSTTTAGNNSSLVSIASNSAWTGFLSGSILIQSVKSSASVLYDSVDGFKCILEYDHSLFYI